MSSVFQADVEIEKLVIADVLGKNLYVSARVRSKLQFFSQIEDSITHKSDLVALHGDNSVSGLESRPPCRTVGNHLCDHDARFRVVGVNT